MIILYILLALLLIVLAYILFIIICSLFINPHKEYETNSRFYRFLLYSATTIVMKVLRIHVHVTGEEKIPEGTKPLFVGNHRSNYDPIVTWHVFEKWEIAFVSKASNFKIPVFGRFIRKCCFMAIDREDPRKAMKTIIKAAGLLKKGDVSVGVYPEGTRSKSGELLPFHDGVFKIAQRADAPIVVMALSGTEQIHKQWIRHRSDVYLDIVDVIPAEEVKGMRTNEIGERVRASLEQGLESRKTVKTGYVQEIEGV